MSTFERLSRVRIAVGAAVVLAAVAGIYTWRATRPVWRSIDAVVVSVDAAARSAVLEFTHPKTGQSFTLSGSVPAECQILIDDQPGQLGDIRPGDHVQASGLLYRWSGHVEARDVHVARGAAPPAFPDAPVTDRPATP